MLIYITPSGTQVLTDSSLSPYDGGDDTSVGVLNASGQTVSSVTVSSGQDIFGFDGDGICTYGWTGSACPYGSTGYEGPGTSFTGINGSLTSGSVVFSGGLPSNGSAFFGLESAVTSARATTSPTYFAMGDSYAAGVGAPPYYGKSAADNCNRSPSAWPIDVGSDESLTIDASSAFVACSGEVSGGMLSSSPGQGTNNAEPSQDTSLNSWIASHGGQDPKLISIMVGGDNVHFAPVLEACFIGNCADTLAGMDYALEHAQSLERNLEKLYAQIKSIAPKSKIVVVGYPKLLPSATSLSGLWNQFINTVSFDPNCFLDYSPLNRSQMIPDLALFAETADLLNGDIKDAASYEGLPFVDESKVMSGHEMCTSNPYVNDIIPGVTTPKTLGLGNGTAAHPTLEGNRAMATQVENLLSSDNLLSVRRSKASHHPSKRHHSVTGHPVILDSGSTYSLDLSALSQPVLGEPYTGYIVTSNGQGASTDSVTSGSLPPGLNLDGTDGFISGVPTGTGSFNFAISATDETTPTPLVASAAGSLTVTSASSVTVSTAVPSATVGQSYTTQLTASGGIAPYSWTISSGALPAGLTMTTDGWISGTPTGSGTSVFTVTATDSGVSPNANSGTGLISLSILPAGSALGVNPPGSASCPQGQACFVQLSSTGGTAPVSWSVSNGTLPDGLVLDPNSGIVSGQVTSSGTATITVTATDRSTPSPQSANASLTISSPGAPSLTQSATTPPNPIQGEEYQATLTASGGVAPYTWSVSGGSLPGGLSLDPDTGVISGTPTSTGAASFTVTVGDGTTPSPEASSQTYTVDVAPSVLAVAATLPNAAEGQYYDSAVTSTGGVAPLQWSLESGSLPAGLSLNSSTGEIVGTPTEAGTFGFTVQASDNSTPVQEASVATSLTVTAAPALTIGSTSLPDAAVSVQYRQLLLASGGVGAYTWSVISGSLPAGLQLDAATGVVSGTPTTPGAYSVVVSVADSASPVTDVTSGTVTINVDPEPPLTVGTTALPDATQGQSYNQLLNVAGGIAPYSYQVTAGSLPAGLVLDAGSGAIAGTPTGAGSSTFSIEVTDSSVTPLTVVVPLTLNVDVGAPLQISTAFLPGATQAQYYDAILSQTGGVAPYTWSVVSGNLPAGLTLDPSGEIYGSPTAFGVSNFTLGVADSSTPTAANASQQYQIVVAPAPPLQVTTTSLPDGTQGQDYSTTIATQGGVGPFTWTVTSGHLPDGLALDDYGDIYGEITSATSTTFTVQVSDSSSPSTEVVTDTYTISVSPAPPLSASGPLPPAYLNQYYDQSLSDSGGSPPYTWTIISGKVPTGLTFSDGTFYGRPTKKGNTSLVVGVSDSSTPSSQTTHVAVQLAVDAVPKLKVGTHKLPAATEGSYFYQVLQASGGIPGYAWSLTSGALPPGMYLDYYGEVYGTPTVPGTYHFTVKVSDSTYPTVQSVAKALTVKVAK